MIHRNTPDSLLKYTTYIYINTQYSQIAPRHLFLWKASAGLSGGHILYRHAVHLVLHVMAHTMKECLKVVKSLTISLRINSSVLINKPCAFRDCAMQSTYSFAHVPKTHAIA